MSWVPANLASLCTVESTYTSCQPTAVMFLMLITRLFGQSTDGIFSDSFIRQNFLSPVPLWDSEYSSSFYTPRNHNFRSFIDQFGFFLNPYFHSPNIGHRLRRYDMLFSSQGKLVAETAQQFNSFLFFIYWFYTEKILIL